MPSMYKDQSLSTALPKSKRKERFYLLGFQDGMLDSLTTMSSS